MASKGSSLQDRLNAHWKKKGAGPDLEAQLKAAQAELKRREDEENGRRRGLVVNNKAADATTAAIATVKSRSEVNIDADEEDKAPPPQAGGGAEEPLPDDEVGQLKLAGSEALQEGDFELALQLYSDALTDPDTGVNRHLDAKVASQLYSNRAQAQLKLQRWSAAAADAAAAATLQPSWPKPLYRLAQAQAELGSFRQAIATCRKGEALLEAAGDHSREFTPLMDRIAHMALLQGSIAAFDGRLLEVRCAGEDAWLGREAPADPLLDAPEEPDAAQTLSVLAAPQGALEAAGGGAERVEAANRAVALVQQEQALLKAGKKHLSYRSLREAVKAAKDGDRILVLRGIHNGGGVSVDVDKRILISGEGALRDATIDQRANCPTFRITRTAAIQNIEVDQSGFRESVCVDGGPSVRPVLDHCIFKCSGDDGMNVSGRAAPTVRDCELVGKNCALKLMDEARGEYVDCKLNTCQQNGLRVHDRARAQLRRCHVQGNLEDGVVVLDQGHVELEQCHIRDNKGAGIDISDAASAAVRDSWIKDNYGGCFLWDTARLQMSNVKVSGGSSHALLADGDSNLRLQRCHLDGVIHASDAMWQSIRSSGSNTVHNPEEPTTFPAEEGAFKFEPDKYRRKQ